MDINKQKYLWENKEKHESWTDFLVNENIKYYYAYLNKLMKRKWILNDTGTCVYPGIWADITTVYNLFWKRNIVWFDSAWINTYEDSIIDSTWGIGRYSAEKINSILSEIKEVKNFDLHSFLENTCDLSYKKRHWGYLTVQLWEWKNSINLLWEILAVWYSPDDIICMEWTENWVRYIEFKLEDTFSIKIYQLDVLDNTNKKYIDDILDREKWSIYLEKSWEKISWASGYTHSCPASLTLEYMENSSATKIITMWSRITSFNKQRFNNRKKLTDIQIENNHEFKDKMYEVSNKTKQNLEKNLSYKFLKRFWTYWWKVDVYHK